MQAFDLTIFADYHQFYIQDDDSRYGDLSDAWTPDATERNLAVVDHGIGIGTARNENVPVRIEILDELPKLDSSQWDLINKTTLLCDTGRIVVVGCTDYFPDAKRILVKPATYDVLVGYKNIKAKSDDADENNDSYHLFIAPKKKG